MGCDRVFILAAKYFTRQKKNPEQSSLHVSWKHIDEGMAIKEPDVTMKRTFLTGVLLSLAACHAGPQTDTAQWLGRWQGVEGTYLDISRTGDQYTVTIADLDGPRAFPATADKDGFSFTRDGIDETIRAGSGADTGMKWLAEKTDCLVIKSGEGYCR